MSVIESVRGRMRDSDSHEFIPAHLWEETFGATAGLFGRFLMEMHDPSVRVSLSAPVERDDAPLGDLETLPKFAVSRYIEFVDSLPTSATGKIQKHLLRARPLGPETWDRERGGPVEKST